MADLLLLRHQTGEAAQSPELRFLAATCLAEARKVFGAVDEVPWRPGATLPVFPEDVPVLLFGAESTYLGRASLARMRSALEAGAELVTPDPVENFDLAGEEPVYTLRGFERLERRRLAAGSPPARRRRSHLPVALVSAPFFDRELRGQAPAALFTEPELLTRIGRRDALVHAGVSFVLSDYYGEVQEDILPLIPASARDVLDVGCGRGGTARLLQERLGCRVTGVELNPEAAREAAEHLHRVIVGDVESLDLASLGGSFDAVVATELFEHLSTPETFLAKARSWLRPRGRIVLSVPNVGHYAVVEDLLAGRWDYVPMGHLCYTHLRFFTRTTLADWLERAGFPSYRILSRKAELPERFASLSAAALVIDRESLATTGFYAVVET